MTETAGLPGDQSTTEQAKEKVQETAQQVQHKAQEVKGQAGNRIRKELDNRSTQAGSQLQFTADAMRRTGQQLRKEGKEGPANVTDLVAKRAERLGKYISEANADRMLRDVENFARRQPWLVAVRGAALGFLASRFLKASSSRRYESSNGSESYRQQGWQSSLPPSGPAEAAGRVPGLPSYGHLEISGAGEYGDVASTVSAPPLPVDTEAATTGTSRSRQSGSRGKSRQ